MSKLKSNNIFNFLKIVKYSNNIYKCYSLFIFSMQLDHISNHKSQWELKIIFFDKDIDVGDNSLWVVKQAWIKL
jgi:hypothetical protein